MPRAGRQGRKTIIKKNLGNILNEANGDKLKQNLGCNGHPEIKGAGKARGLSPSSLVFSPLLILPTLCPSTYQILVFTFIYLINWTNRSRFPLTFLVKLIL